MTFPSTRKCTPIGRPSKNTRSRKMKYTLHPSDINDSALDEEVWIHTILECLTGDCKNCSGSYINKLFGHKLICACTCHYSKRDEDGHAAKTVVSNKVIQNG